MKNTSKLNTILLIILIILALGIIWVLWHDRKAEEGKDTYFEEVVTNNSDLNENLEVTENGWVIYRNKDLGISFAHPKEYNVKIKKIDIDPLYNTYNNYKSSYIGEITNGANVYYFSDFDYQRDTSDVYRRYLTIDTYKTLGILFWKSNGSGTRECGGTKICTYSDKFDFGARFDINPSKPENRSIVFYATKFFNDGKTEHFLRNVQESNSEYFDFFNIVGTLEFTS